MAVSSHPVSGAALDKLNGMLQRCDRTGGQQNVEVIRHQHERMKGESALILVMEQTINKEQTVLLGEKEGTTLPCSRRNEICAGNLCVTLWNSHTLSC